MTMVFEQITGPRRKIELRGRSMPFRPITLEHMQRVTTTWMPAAIKAVQQVLGPQHEPTPFTGNWQDKFLGRDENSATLINFPRLSPAAAGIPGFGSATNFVGSTPFPGTQTVKLAAVLADAFELLVDEGQDVRWQWSQFVRYGKLRRLKRIIGVPTGGIDCIDWEVECTWSGKVALPPIPTRRSLNLLSTAQGLAKLLEQLAALVDRLSNLAQPNAFVQAVLAPISSLSSSLSSAIALLRSAVAIVTLPIDLAQTIVGILQAIKLEAQRLREQVDRIGSASQEAAKVGAADAVAIAALVQAQLRDWIVRVGGYAAEQQRLLSLFTGAEVIASFFADSTSSLRDVATRFYGRPEEWIRISNYNGFYASTVPAGTLVLVPKITGPSS